MSIVTWNNIKVYLVERYGTDVPAPEVYALGKLVNSVDDGHRHIRMFAL